MTDHSILWGIAALFLATLPWWLPPYVIKLRMALFTRINGDSGGLPAPLPPRSAAL